MSIGLFPIKRTFNGSTLRNDSTFVSIKARDYRLVYKRYKYANKFSANSFFLTFVAKIYLCYFNFGLNSHFLGNVIIIGGGLAGLISGIQLRKKGIPCLLVEKKSYPLHRVCGEYVSNEAFPFLKREGLFPEKLFPPQINEFLLSSVTGKVSTMKLDLGGFGISRFSLDFFLYQIAKNAGVEFLLETEVTSVKFSNDRFAVEIDAGLFDADVVIGAQGKRSKLDVSLNRAFVEKRSPYVGIKYHARNDHPANQIALHNFEGGYCGINRVEDGISNICYLSERKNLRIHGSIEALERNVLFKNPKLKEIFSNSDFLFKKPEVINEISFETKSPVEQHMLMTGDSAGMITPLCGNGMAIAIHSAKIAAEIIPEFLENKISRQVMEDRYRQEWSKNFSGRLWRGRKIQNLFGNPTLSSAAVNLVLYSRPLANLLVRNTHGQPF
jgi:menaquinone-9 beta-reductase